MAPAAYFCVAFVALTWLAHVDGHHFKLSPLLLGLHKYRGTSSIFLTFSRNDRDLQKYTWAQRLTREFSRENVMTLVTDFKNLDECVSWYRKRILRPLVVAFFHRPSDIAEFNESTKLIGLDHSVWVMIFTDELDKAFCEYCKSPRGRIFPVRFDTEMVVLCCDDPMLKEWWAFHENHTEITDYAIWKKSDELLVLDANELYVRRHDVKGAPLRVGIVTSSALVQEDGDRIGGFFGEILTEFQRVMNFTVTNIVRDPEYGSWNTETKSWSGLLDRMSRGDIDVGVGDFAILESRRNIVDFTIPLILSRNRLYIRDVDSNISWSAYYQAFAIDIWIVIVITIMTASLLITVIKLHGHSMSLLSLFCENCISVLGIFCDQGLVEFPPAMSLRIAYFSIFLSSLVVSAAYSGSMISFLTVSSSTLPFTTLQGFVEDGSYKIITYQNNAVFELFKTSPDPILRKIEALMKPVEQMPVDMKSAWDDTCDQKVAFYTTELSKEVDDINIKCKVTGIDTGRLDNLAMIMPAGSQYTNAFNYHILTLQDTGLMRRLKRKYLTRNRADKREVFDDVKLWDAAPALVILAGGIVLAMFVLFCEGIYYSWKNILRNKTRWQKLCPIKSPRWARVFGKGRSLQKQKAPSIVEWRN